MTLPRFVDHKQRRLFRRAVTVVFLAALGILSACQTSGRASSKSRITAGDVIRQHERISLMSSH